MATRIELRDYYRKSMGIFATINAFWLLCISGLAIYISDYAELSPETNTEISEFLLYGFYATFLVGAIIVLLVLIGGIVALRSESEGVFKFLQTVSIVIAVISVVFTYSAAYSAWFAKVVWNDKGNLSIVIIGFVLGLITLAYSVMSVVLSVIGRKYYDIDKKKAKDVGNQVQVNRLNEKFTGYMMMTFLLFSLAVYAFSYYFKTEIIKFDDIQGENNAKYIGLFNRVFIAGLVMSVIQLVMTICVFVKGGKTIMYANKLIVIGQLAVIMFYIIVTIAINDKTFTKLNYPDMAYIIFSYLMIAVNLVIAIKTFRQKISD